MCPRRREAGAAAVDHRVIQGGCQIAIKKSLSNTTFLLSPHFSANFQNRERVILHNEPATLWHRNVRVLYVLVEVKARDVHLDAAGDAEARTTHLESFPGAIRRQGREILVFRIRSQLRDWHRVGS